MRLPVFSKDSDKLTTRENEIVQFMLTGSKTNANIAKQLNMSEGTVKMHLKHIFYKLGVSSRFELVTKASNEPS